MKTIIKNKNRYILKNNKLHCLYYSYFSCHSNYVQENSSHHKHLHYGFHNRVHGYYLRSEGKQRGFLFKRGFAFNDLFIGYENNNKTYKR
jgi:hypothetical protein